MDSFDLLDVSSRTLILNCNLNSSKIDPPFLEVHLSSRYSSDSSNRYFVVSKLMEIMMTLTPAVVVVVDRFSSIYLSNHFSS